jgi:hypothetical protein
MDVEFHDMLFPEYDQTGFVGSRPRDSVQRKETCGTILA